MEKAGRFQELLSKHLAQELTASEQQELNVLLSSSTSNQQLMNNINIDPLATYLEEWKLFDEEAVWNDLRKKFGFVDNPAPRHQLNIWYKLAIAAVIIGAISTIVIVIGTRFLSRTTKDVDEVPYVFKGDTAAIKNKVRLTLSDGSVVLLDSLNPGVIGMQGNVTLLKSADGHLVYTASSDTLLPENQEKYNTITVPKATRYTVMLPDGTTVLLNATSSLRFPIHFGDSARVVELKGEAYFDISKVKKGVERIPFRVKAGNVIVDVLGTRFNISAYEDEVIIRTTILEGKVAMHAETTSQLLLPGDQGAFDKQLLKLKVQQVDTSLYVGWMEGKLIFEQDPFPVAMRKIARGYDIEIIYRDKKSPSDKAITFEMSDKLSLQSMLTVLRLYYNDVEFTLDGKTLIVSQKFQSGP